MPQKEYPLLLDEAMYADMVQNGYDSSQWMAMQPVRAKAMKISRSKKKMEELCKKGAIVKGDTWTMRKTGRDGITITFSATIKKLDQHSFPVMETTGKTDGKTWTYTWTCAGPNEFDQAMVQIHSNLERSFRKTWDKIYVTRKNQELGSLYLLRQCFQLWENEIKKWGCNGLGEDLDDKLLVPTHLACSTAKLTEGR